MNSYKNLVFILLIGIVVSQRLYKITPFPCNDGYLIPEYCNIQNVVIRGCVEQFIDTSICFAYRNATLTVAFRFESKYDIPEKKATVMLMSDQTSLPYFSLTDDPVCGETRSMEVLRFNSSNNPENPLTTDVIRVKLEQGDCEVNGCCFQFPIRYV